MHCELLSTITKTQTWLDEEVIWCCESDSTATGFNGGAELAQRYLTPLVLPTARNTGAGLIPLSCKTKHLEQGHLQSSLLIYRKVPSFLIPANFIAVGKNTFPKTQAVVRYSTSDVFIPWEAILCTFYIIHCCHRMYEGTAPFTHGSFWKSLKLERQNCDFFFLILFSY